MDLDAVYGDDDDSEKASECGMLADIAIEKVEERCGDDAVEAFERRLLQRDDDSPFDEAMSQLRNLIFPPSYKRPRDCDDISDAIVETAEMAQQVAEDNIGDPETQGNEWAMSNAQYHQVVNRVDATLTALVGEVRDDGCLSEDNLEDLDTISSAAVSALRDGKWARADSNLDGVIDLAGGD